jgi:hypothetical protein
VSDLSCHGDISYRQEIILLMIDSAGRWVHQDTFNGLRGGSGASVAGLVRRGMLLWERKRKPDSFNATGLYLTVAGQDQVDAIRKGRA